MDIHSIFNLNPLTSFINRYSRFLQVALFRSTIGAWSIRQKPKDLKEVQKFKNVQSKGKEHFRKHFERHWLKQTYASLQNFQRNWSYNFCTHYFLKESTSGNLSLVFPQKVALAVKIIFKIQTINLEKQYFFQL